MQSLFEALSHALSPVLEVAATRRVAETLRKEILGHARKRLGPALAPREIAFQVDLPKTRSQIFVNVGNPEQAFALSMTKTGLDLDEVHQLSKIDPWFLAQIEDLVREEEAVRAERSLLVVK